jgi:hypothetical protein
MMIFLAIDDTDNLETMGTGRLSRLLATELKERGLTDGGSVTRHQLLIHPDIPYTSHNSAACIQAEGRADLRDIFAAAQTFMLDHPHEGANPGLCLAPAEAVPPVLAQFGSRAQKEVIPLSEGYGLAGTEGILTWRNGPTGQGLIGAMSAVGLRSTGQDGRFIELEGIRKLKGDISVARLLEQTEVDDVATMEGRSLGGDELLYTQAWVRPSLRQGKAVFLVKRENDAWVPALKRKKDEDDGQEAGK